MTATPSGSPTAAFHPALRLRERITPVRARLAVIPRCLRCRSMQQVRNPVSLFATDNNGVILELPAVPIGGQAGIAAGQGSLVFGIGTQSNNGLGSAVVLPLDSNPNDPAWAGITTVYNGVSYPNAAENTTLVANGSFTFGSFLDSGSNGFFFLDQPHRGYQTAATGTAPAPPRRLRQSTKRLAATVTGCSSASATPTHCSTPIHCLQRPGRA